MVVWTRVTFALALKMLSFIKEKGGKNKKIQAIWGESVFQRRIYSAKKQTIC
ncbi:MAG: hypothetical protein ACOYIC_01645 [Butyricicoccus sp.]|jgi:hypothetical protein